MVLVTGKQEASINLGEILGRWIFTDDHDDDNDDDGDDDYDKTVTMIQ